jgi:hypothetical protein
MYRPPYHDSHPALGLALRAGTQWPRYLSQAGQALGPTLTKKEGSRGYVSLRIAFHKVTQKSCKDCYMYSGLQML